MAIFVQQSRTILAILVEGHPRNISEVILKLGHWPRRRCCLVFLFLAMMAILFNRVEPFSNFDTGSPKEHSNEISKSIHRFMRRCDLSKLLMTEDA